MTAFFNQGFFVRVPAWHGEGIVLADYPGREEAMRLAGHDWDVIERDIAIVGSSRNSDGSLKLKAAPEWKAHLRSDTLGLLNVCKTSFERIQNSVAYDVAELLLDQAFKYETGITLKDGAECALTLFLDEPIVITGDNSATLPYVGLSWAHDGSAALKLRSTSVRQVCANTVAASEAEGKRLGTDFTFRHTKNVHERIADAKAAIKGTRQAIDVYRVAMESLAALPVTPDQRDLFVSTIIGDRDGVISKSAAASDRVKNNIERERTKILSLFMGKTIPEAHALTGYGLHLAGVEYFDHLRGLRGGQDSYVRRTLLKDSAEKASLNRTIREVVAA